MTTEDDAVPQQLNVRAVFAPLFSGLGIAAGVVDLWIDSRAMVWLGLLCLALGLHFSRYTRNSFLGEKSDSPRPTRIVLGQER